MPKSLKPFIKTFHYGDFRYASVQNDFGFNVHMDRQLEALVLDCPLGIISTLVRPVQGGFDPSKIPKAEQPIYDWSEVCRILHKVLDWPGIDLPYFL